MNRMLVVLLGAVCIFAQAQAPDCPGSTNLPADLASKMVAVDDTNLLNSALGKKDMGGLCMGQAYEVKPDQQVTVYRAWNSTNPGSQFGSWWAFEEPNGSIADYRSAYQICFQWSPLDTLVSCTLEPGQRVVVGPGQSAVCSAYLTYPTSAKQQIYMQATQSKLANCTVKQGQFRWQ